MTKIFRRHIIFGIALISIIQTLNTNSIYALTNHQNTLKTQNYQQLQSLSDKIFDLSQIFMSIPDVNTKEKTGALIKLLRTKKEYREIGMNIWDQYPHDPLRYEWFFTTVINNCDEFSFDYWSNFDSSVAVYFLSKIERKSFTLPLDNSNCEKWNNIYPRMKEETLKYNLQNCTSEQFAAKSVMIATAELSTYLNQQENLSVRDNKTTILSKTKSFFINAVSASNLSQQSTIASLGTPLLGRGFVALSTTFFSNYRLAGLDHNDIQTFLLDLKENSDPNIRLYADKMNKTFSLHQSQLLLEGITLESKGTNLEKYKGKIVLLDFWGLGCSYCIKRMPYIKYLHEKYKDKGFVVISLCADDSSRLARILDVENKINAQWETWMLSETQSESIFSKKFLNDYGYWGFPRMLLLDRDHKLLLYNNELQKGDCEELINSALNGTLENNL